MRVKRKNRASGVTYQGLNEGLAEGVEDMELGEGCVVAVEGRQEENMLAADLVFRVESS